MSRRTAVPVLIVALVAACGFNPEPSVDDPCPRTVEEALESTISSDVLFGTGHVIRFVPSPQVASRGYEINLSTRHGEPYFETVLLRTMNRLPNIADGQPVLLLADRTDRNLVVTPGVCEPLVPVPESDVD